MLLGETWLSNATLDFFSSDIASWGDSLTESGDLLFYGCDLASTSEGRSLLESVSELCDCDVAASTDDTGNASFGGDWDLEFATGSIEAEVAFSMDAQEEWAHLLNVSVDATSTGSTATGSTATSSTATGQALPSHTRHPGQID